MFFREENTMKTKKILCAIVCVILLTVTALPAYADASDNHSHIEYGLGVRVNCTSYLCITYAKSTLKLSFVSGVNHLPQSDYAARACATVYYPGGSISCSSTGNMSAAATAYVSDGKTATSSSHTYYVNNTQVYSKTLS